MSTDAYKMYISYDKGKTYVCEYIVDDVEEIKDLIRAFERRKMVVDFYVKHKGKTITVSPYSKKKADKATP